MDSNHWLKHEANKWKKEGIINSSQEQAILAKYHMAEKPKHVHVKKEEDNSNKTITVVAIIGAILVGLGIIVFMAANWQVIPAVIKLILLFGATFGIFIGGKWMEENEHPIIGRSLLFLGALFTGATIFLTAQIFHIQANAPWLVLLWFLAVAPLSYGFHSRPILVLALALFGLWMVMYGEEQSAGALLFYGFSMYGIGYAHIEHSKFENFKAIFQGVGLVYTLSWLYAAVISELHIIELFEKSNWLLPVFLILSIICVGIATFFMGRGDGKMQEFAWLLLAFIMSIILWVIPLADIRASLGMLVLIHIMFFALVVLTFLSGYYQKEAVYINIGLLFFVLYVGYFYFTTVFRYMPKSLALILAGIILLVGGWYLEKKRRNIILEIGA